MTAWTSLDGYIVIKCSEMAVLIDNGKDQTWVPRSVIMDGDALDDGATDITVLRWFADREGLEG